MGMLGKPINNDPQCVISGFRRDVDEICALLGYYAALGGSSVPTFRDYLTVPIFKGQELQEDFVTFEDETDRLSQKVGT
jgi:hypothetical protein